MMLNSNCFARTRRRPRRLVDRRERLTLGTHCPFISGEGRARGAVILSAFLDLRGMAVEGRFHDGISRLRSDVQALGSLRS